MKGNFYLYLLVFLFPLFCFSQQNTFFKTYGDTAESHDDVGHAVLQTEDGGYVVAGNTGWYFTGPPYHFFGNVFLMKTNQFGDTIWTKTYGDTIADQVAYSMDRTGDGGFILCCYNASFYDMWLIKTDSNGDSLWTKKYRLWNADGTKGTCIEKTNDGGFVITGIDSNGDIFLLKTDAMGDSVWLRTYDYGKGWYVQQTSDGGYIISATTEDILLIKTDSLGDTLWTKVYGGFETDIAHSLCETEDGGYLIAGEYTELGELGLEIHIWLLKTDAYGDTLWTRKINNGSWGDYAYSMEKTLDGGFIIAGETVYDTFDADIYLIKLDRDGNVQWTSTIGKDLNEPGSEKQYRGKDIVETLDGGYIITGKRTTYFGLDRYIDICLLKVNSSGKITSLNEVNESSPSDYTLYQNFPNPFNPTTEILFQMPKREHVSVTIYDMLGREILTLLNEEKEPGIHKVGWDGKNKYGMAVSSGVYIYKMESGSNIRSKKMVFIK